MTPLAARFSAPAAGRKLLTTLGARQITVIASDGGRDRMGDILMPGGCVLENFKRNPVVLAQHDAAQPIARCSQIEVSNGQVVATIDFPAEGVSARSDEYLRLVKAGVLGAVSVGFLPLKSEPMRGGGILYTSWELLELSIVSVPANPAALVTGKAMGAARARQTADAEGHRALIARAGAEHAAAAEERMRERRAALLYANQFATLRW
ncbi:MAG: HK97 family phage prohead protease [Rhodospirillales bacterium]|nr:HK97 family phage prohead protease [Rhodospirillales bacterium]